MRLRVTAGKNAGGIRESVGFMQLKAETEEDRQFLTQLFRALEKPRALSQILRDFSDDTVNTPTPSTATSL